MIAGHFLGVHRLTPKVEFSPTFWALPNITGFWGVKHSKIRMVALVSIPQSSNAKLIGFNILKLLFVEWHFDRVTVAGHNVRIVKALAVVSPFLVVVPCRYVCYL